MSKKIVYQSYSKHPKTGVTVDKSNVHEKSSSEEIKPMEYIDANTYIKEAGAPVEEAVSIGQCVKEVLDFVVQVGPIAPKDLEESVIGSLTKSQIQCGLQRLIYTGKLYINSDLKLVSRK